MKNSQFHPLDALVEAFLFDRKVQNFTPGTVVCYRGKLKRLRQYCQQVGSELVEKITPATLCVFRVFCQTTGFSGHAHIVDISRPQSKFCPKLDICRLYSMKVMA